ncbi:MAG: hypothetical protein MUF15_18015 [Acidobacteria bacterium]|nr:hypothetical protein [Acidobacteriota bacterium]
MKRKSYSFIVGILDLDEFFLPGIGSPIRARADTNHHLLAGKGGRDGLDFIINTIHAHMVRLGVGEFLGQGGHFH